MVKPQLRIWSNSKDSNCLPGSVWNDDKGEREHMMYKHDHKVFPFLIHVKSGVDRVQVESAFDVVEERYVRWNFHANGPILK